MARQAAERLNNRVAKTILRLQRAESRRFVENTMIMGLVGIAIAAGLIAFAGQISSALSSIGTSL
jgi:Flp pilus assembly pilin Flp